MVGALVPGILKWMLLGSTVKFACWTAATIVQIPMGGIPSPMVGLFPVSHMPSSRQLSPATPVELTVYVALAQPRDFRRLIASVCGLVSRERWRDWVELGEVF